MALFPDSSLFIVTSDNLEFARKNIPTQGRNVIFIEGERYYIDFFLQTLCKNNIICNSTFSWWSAWLNQNPNKVVVRPKVWWVGIQILVAQRNGSKSMHEACKNDSRSVNVHLPPLARGEIKIP